MSLGFRVWGLGFGDLEFRLWGFGREFSGFLKKEVDGASQAFREFIRLFRDIYVYLGGCSLEKCVSLHVGCCGEGNRIQI